MKESHHIVSIQDTGVGMSETTSKHIFEKFYQGKTSRSHEGSGLGLPLVKSMLNLHQGRIDLQSQLNECTTVSVILPSTRRFL